MTKDLIEQAMIKLKNCCVEPRYLYCNSKENITKADIPPNIILVKSPLVELGKVYIASENIYKESENERKRTDTNIIR